MSVVVIGLSHRTSPVELRERFALGDADLLPALDRLRANGQVEEAVVLATCNRVEAYIVCRQFEKDAAAHLWPVLFPTAAAEPAPRPEIYTLAAPQSFQHLFRVAAGLDSMVLGETEILGQLKKAYEFSRQHSHTGRVLNKAFQKAFNVAKHLRSQTGIQRGTWSVGSVAVELAEKIFNSLRDRRVLVIGAGDTSEKTARALLSRGASSILVANRSFERAQALAGELGGQAVRFEDWNSQFEQIDIAISSTAAPHYILDRAKLIPLMKLRRNRALLLIDIAVPRDIHPEVASLENVYLYNIDDLQAIADDCLKQRQEEIARCEAVIAEDAQALMENLAKPGAAPKRLAFEHE